MAGKRAVVVVALLAGLLAWAGPARACSRPIPPTLAQILDPAGLGRDWPSPEVTIAGVYEQTHIASAPSLVVRDVRTVSVVTRYWGTPPDLGRVMHGDGLGILGGDSCGNESGSAGDVGYHWVVEQGQRRFLPYIETAAGWSSRLTPAEEADLVARFGSPVVLEVNAITRIAALFQLWWLPALGAGIAGGGLAGVFALRRRRSGPEAGDDL